jgi:ABC-type spermidine/putrescine transport system permease subunit I
MISLKIDVKRFTWLLVIVYLILLILNIVVVFLRHKFMTDSGAVEQLDRYFNFATEVNLPTFFNAVLIFT